ncbi:hypothetical protein HYH03_009944 [Edaphochlamys debaryana]|uniref:Uncharacterized protein n=1 Tax=Edaphochlamys debaryana TaxID=47281 RepID=A0A836BY17_9CHLO|nr:hypothetical protein HYH03_009944 [Edaphochlamys debaryana]|eukprot:KAG2491784.1 hypothetical protein HYH03_009944 [Edaphochlamys debaryana]
MLGVEPGVRASAVGVAVATAGAPAPVGLGQPASAPQGTHGRPQPEFELGGGSGAGAGSGSNGGGGWGKGDGPGSDGFCFGSNGGEQSRGGFAGWIFALAAALACLGPFAAWQLRASRPLPASAPLREALPLAPFMLGSAGATGATIRARRLQARTSVGGAGAPSNRLAMWVPWLPLYPAPGADPDGRSLERVESALSRMLREQGPWRQTDPYGFWHGGEGWGAPLRSSGPRHGSPGGSGAGSPRASTAGLGGGGKGAEAAAGMRLPLASATAARGAEGPRSRGRALHESVGGGVEVVGFHDEIDAMGRVRDGLHRAHGVAQVWLGSRRGAKGEEGARREAATLAV